MSNQASSSAPKSSVAIAIAIVSLVGTVISGYFTWSGSKEIEQIKASSAKELEILRQNFEKYKIDQASAERNAASKQANKLQRCSSMRELHLAMAQEITNLYENDGIDVITKANKLRAKAAQAIAFFGSVGDATYRKIIDRPSKPGDIEIVNRISAATAALAEEIRECNAN